MVVQVDRRFAHLLKQYREQGRVSQSRLAELSGFDHSYVSRLESSHRSPTRDAVVRFAEALGLAEPDRDNLLAAAGFMPTRVESLLADEPVLTEVFQLLQSPAVPQSVREDVRQMLQLVVRQARLAAAANPRSAEDEDQVLAAD